MPRFRLPARPGFTLMEIMVTMGIIVILSAVVIVALNPQRNFGFAHNAERLGDISSIVSAVLQYGVDNDFLPSTIPAGTGGTAVQICQYGYLPSSPDECVDLSILSGVYLYAMPVDPALVGTQTGYTGYYIAEQDNSVIWATAPYGLRNFFPQQIMLVR